MEISFLQAHELSIAAFCGAGFAQDEAKIITDHILYAEASGEKAGGLVRISALIEEFRDRPKRQPLKIDVKGRSSAMIDGGGNTGYITSHYAIDTAISLAKSSGFGVVGMTNSWFSGQLSYYVSRAAEAGLIAFHCAGAKARVAPWGSVDPILGTNPIAFGFPCDPEPFVVDIGTASVTVAHIMMAQKLGESLAQGIGFDAQGKPSQDPTAVWHGALQSWGGHRGSAIAMAVHAFGILSGGLPVVTDVSDTGFFFLVIDPELLMPLPEFRAKLGQLLAEVEASAPAEGVEKVRIPGRSSAARRAEAERRGTFELDEIVFNGLVDMGKGIFRDAALSNRATSRTA